MRRSRFAGCVAAVAMLFAGATAHAQSIFPDFTARDAMSGRQFSLSDLRGKVVVVDFWATWCGPCVKELPNVKRAYAKYRRNGLEVVSISLDKDINRCKRFIRNQNMAWINVVEGGGWNTRLAKQYGIRSIPRMIVIGPDGAVIADRVRGGALERAIERGLTMVAREEPEPRRDAPERDEEPALADAPPLDLTELLATRDGLAAIDASISAVGDRLAGIIEDLDRLERQLPAPAAPSRTAKRVTRLHGDLTDARRELFLLGLLDEEKAIVFPPDPMASGAPKNAATWSRVLEAIPAYRDAVRAMREAGKDVASRIADIEAEISAVERDAARRRQSVTARRAEAVRREAAEVIEQFDGAWVAQLETAERIITRCCEPIDATRARLDAAAERIEAIRNMLAAEPREIDQLGELRSEFETLCNELEAVSAKSGVTPPTPTNPYDTRRLKDRRALRELDAQLGVAQAAVDTIRAKMAATRKRYDKLAAETATLRAEIDKRGDAGAAMEDLRKRFSDLSLKVLALHDPAT